MVVEFTQYMMPDGRQVPVTTTMDGRWQPVVAHVMAHDRRFECEVLTTGEVSFTIFDKEKEEDICIGICGNGPVVREALEKMFSDYQKRFMQQAEAN